MIEAAQGFTAVVCVVACSLLLLTHCGGEAVPMARGNCEHPSTASPECAYLADWVVWQCPQPDGTFWELQRSGEWIHSESKPNAAGELDKLCDIAPDGGLIWSVK